MIILDANTLKGISLRGAEAEILRAIRTSKVERVAAPWIVLEEIAAQQALSYAKKHDAAVRALEDLDKASPWTSVRTPARTTPSGVRSHWRGLYSALAEVLPTNPEAYQQALFREANLIAPCKTVNSGKHKTGARDAAIWLTAVEYAKSHPAETVYFVSNNTEDFGDGSKFPPDLAVDIHEFRDRFVLFTSLGDVLAKFAAEIEASEDEVRALLDTPENRETVVREIQGHVGKPRSTISRLTAGGEVLDVHVGHFRNLRALGAKLGRVANTRGYEIGGHRWFTADTRWLIAFQDLFAAASGLYGVWQSRVLVSPTAQDGGVTAIQQPRILPITTEEQPDLPPAVITQGIDADVDAYRHWILHSGPSASGLPGPSQRLREVIERQALVRDRLEAERRLLHHLEAEHDSLSHLERQIAMEFARQQEREE